MIQPENTRQLTLDDTRTVIINRSYDSEGTKLKKTISYLSLVLLSFFFGLNHTSYLCLLDYSFEHYPVEFTPSQKEIAQNLPPTFFFIGGICGILILFNLPKYKFTDILITSTILMIISYGACFFYPHIGMIYAFRVILGVSSSAISLIVPQLLYGFTTKWYKFFIVSTFPFFLVLGLGTSIALIPFSVTYFNFVACFPIILATLTLCLLLLFPLVFKSASREKSDLTIKKFFTDERYMKSSFMISFIFLSCKASGADFIGFFSSSLFSGPYAYWYSLSPFGVGLLLTFIGSCLPNLVGRKITYVVGLCALCCTFIDIFIEGPNIIAVLLFTLIYNCCCAVVPYIIPNEVVPVQYRSIANELGQISFWFFGFLFSLVTVFLYKKGSKDIFIFFLVANIVCALVIFVVLPETKKTKDFDFIKKWDDFGIFRCLKSKKQVDSNA